MNDATQPAVAQGSLGKTPFAHLVLYLYQRRSSGTLILDAAGHETRVLFHRGRAVAAHVARSAATLDEGLLPLCALTEGAFKFHDSDLVGSGPSILTGMFDPFAFVAEAARRYARSEVVLEVLAKFAGMPLTVQPAMDPSRLSPTPSEAKFAALLTQASLTIDELCAQSELELDAAQRLLYVLLITKILGPVADSSASSVRVGRGEDASRDGTSRSPSASGVGTSILPGKREAGDRSRSSGAAWRAIAMRAAEMSTNRPSPRPGTPTPSMPPGSRPASSTSGSQPAFRPISRPLTPPPGSINPTPTHESREPIRRPASRPLTPAPGSANQTPARAQPPARPASRPLTPPPFANTPPSGTPRTTTPSSPVSRVTPRPSPTPLEMLDAAGKYRRVEQLCQRHAYEEALPVMRDLVEADRKNAKYLGMLSHVLLGINTDNMIGKEIVETVNQALRMDPDQVQALYTKARCYKRMGKDREALHYFRRTVVVDPHHLEATREVRLLLLRMSEKKGKR